MNEIRTPLYIFALVVSFGVGYNYGTPNYEKPDPPERTLTLLERQWSHLNENNRKQVIWLARAVYSETKRKTEMVSIAWTVRNRVETGYRGDTYKEVVLHHDQFSGLMPNDNQYDHNISLKWEDRKKNKAWKNAIKISIGVMNSLGYMRPFEKNVRHFYSPVATSAPNWAIGNKAVRLIRKDKAKTRNLKNIRFAFYKNIN